MASPTLPIKTSREHTKWRTSFLLRFLERFLRDALLHYHRIAFFCLPDEAEVADLWLLLLRFSSTASKHWDGDQDQGYCEPAQEPNPPPVAALLFFFFFVLERVGKHGHSFTRNLRSLMRVSVSYTHLRAHET